MSSDRLGYFAPAFLVLLIALGVVSTAYGYIVYNKITDYTPPYLQPDFPDRTWVEALSLFWTLSPGDHINFTMQFDPRIDPSSIFLYVASWNAEQDFIYYSIYQQSRTNTTNLVDSWNHTYAELSALKEGTLALNFTDTHHYNVRVYWYINASAFSLPYGESPPRLFYAVVYRNPDDQANGLFFIGLGIFLFAISPSPFVWRFLKKRHWSWPRRLRLER